MTLMSWVFKRFIRNTSDYFRGGGEMLWWMAGAGAFMVSFSAFTFTGNAGKAYTDGPVVMVIFVGNALGFLINYSQMNFLIPKMYAAILTTTLLGLAVNYSLVALERRFSRWRT